MTRGPQQQANAQSAVPAYKVGYGRPPIEHQFKRGQSLNPRGRPAGRKNNKTIFAQILRETIEASKAQNLERCRSAKLCCKRKHSRGLKAIRAPQT